MVDVGLFRSPKGGALMANAISTAAEEGSDHLYPCFSRADVAFTHGKGAWLYDCNGVRYLDFATGIAVTGLGHSHPELIDALERQGRKHLAGCFAKAPLLTVCSSAIPARKRLKRQSRQRVDSNSLQEIPGDTGS